MTSRKKEAGQADNTLRARKIEEALKSYGVVVRLYRLMPDRPSPQFGVEPGWDIKTREIKERDKDGNISSRIEKFPAPELRWTGHYIAQ